MCSENQLSLRPPFKNVQIMFKSIVKNTCHCYRHFYYDGCITLSAIARVCYRGCVVTVCFIYATFGKTAGKKKKEELGGRPTVIWQMNSETNNSETDNQPVIFHGDTLV